MKLMTSLTLTSFLLLSLVTACSSKDKEKKEDAAADAAAAPQTTQVQTMSSEQVQAATADWSAEHKQLINQLVSKYGQPNESTSDSIIWNNNGQWEKTVVKKNDSNLPLEQTAKLKIPTEKVGDIALFDKAITVDTSSGTVTSAAKKEDHNYLALNLTQQVAMGEMSPMEARRQYTELHDVSSSNTRSLNFDETIQAEETEVKK